MTAVLKFENLTLGYDRHPAVHHLSGEVEQGGLLAIVGPNGAGKSTLLRGIVGALKPIGGRIGLPVGSARDIAYLPQAAEIDRSFPISVYEFIAMGAWRQIGLWSALSGALKHRIGHAIAAVGLTGFEARPIGTLSGGQMQRVLFARLLLQDSPLILLDEPFTAIDHKTTMDLLDLVRRWHGEKRTVVAVLHDMAIVRDVFPECLLLAREKIAWGPTEATLCPENLLAARRMVEAFDSHAHICERAA